MKKRLIALLLALCAAVGTLPMAASAENIYCINGAYVACDDFTSTPGECREYAVRLYYKIWGETFNSYFNEENNSLRNLDTEALRLTEESLKAYVTNAELGAILRVTKLENLYRNDGSSGHSQIIVQKDSEGFTVLEGGLSAYPHYREHYYTWSEYVNTRWLGMKYKYIKYIKWPGAPEYLGPDVQAPEVSGLDISVYPGQTAFSVSFSAMDDRSVSEVYLRVWPQGGSEARGRTYRCEWDGTTASAVVSTEGFAGAGRNYYCRWYAVDRYENISREGLYPQLVSLYAPDLQCRGVGEAAAGAALRNAPCEKVDRVNTLVRRLEREQSLTFTGIRQDGDGRYWYLLEDGLWIAEEDLRYNTYESLAQWLREDLDQREIVYLDQRLLFCGS